ncbi:AAA family ATPase [archaeon]|nr:AAA family ATPase [archaeon]
MKITLSGLPYSGKGELSKKLVPILKIPCFSVGDLRREYAQKKNITITQLNVLAEKDPQSDKLADEYQQAWAKEHQDFLLEGRLSYYFIKDSIKLFLTVSPEEAAKRALLDDRSSESKENSIEKQIEKNNKRCNSDVKRYFALHKIKNCYDPKNFDIIIDTTNLTKEEVLGRTLEELEKLKTNL